MSKKKRELWPYAIVLVLLTFMSGIVYAMSVMMSQSVPLVAEDYYVQELTFQGQIDKEQRARQDGRVPEIEVLQASSALQVTFPGYSHELNEIKGNINFVRPSDPELDFTLKVQPDEDAKQWVSLRSIANGLWLLQFDFEMDGKGYFYEESINY